MHLFTRFHIPNRNLSVIVDRGKESAIRAEPGAIDAIDLWGAKWAGLHRGFENGESIDFLTGQRVPDFGIDRPVIRVIPPYNHGR